MTRLLLPQVNCWQAFLACLTDSTPNETSPCSTDRDDWEGQTNKFLAAKKLFYIEVSPSKVTVIPEGVLVGAKVQGGRFPHIIIAKAKQWISHTTINHRFVVEHDPAGQWQKGSALSPDRIVILCKLIK